MNQAKSILIVDDEESIRKILKTTLEGKGYKVDIAENGEEALIALKINDYNLIISDMKMPKMDGIEFLKNLKERKSKALILFLTSAEKQEVLSRALQYGIDGFIEKPFHPEEVLGIVEEKLKTT